MIKKLVSILLLAVTTLSCKEHRNDTFNSDDIRIMREIAYEVVYDSRLSQFAMKDDRASRVAFIKIYHGGLYAYDIQTNQVIQFDSLGLITKRYGLGHGRGPGEFEQLSRFDVGDEMIVVADPILKRLSYFDIIDGNLISTKPTKFHPLGIAFISGGGDVAVLHTMRDSLLYLYPFDKLSYTSAWKLAGYDTGGDYLMSMNGDILASGDSIVYYPNLDHRNFTIILDSTGVLQTGPVSATVDTFTFRPSIKTGAEMGYRILSPDFTAFRRPSGSVGGYEYIACKFYDVERFDERIVHRFYLDRYSNGGTYIDTIDLTNFPFVDNVNDIREVLVTEQHIVLNIEYNDLIILRVDNGF